MATEELSTNGHTWEELNNKSVYEDATYGHELNLQQLNTYKIHGGV